DGDDAVGRRRSALRVQRAEDEVAGLRGGQCRRDRLQVAQLAYEDDVGVLAQSGAQRLCEAGRVGTDLTLVDDAALVAVEELDRVLDREDVLRPVAVDLVDQRGERRRLTRARRARDEDEPARLLGELVQRRRDAELLERLQLGRDETEGRPDRLALEVDVHTKAGEARDRMREVELAVE